MLLRRRSLYGNKVYIPRIYQQVEWLGNAKSQYINTGIIVSSNYCQVIADCQLTNTENSQNYMWGHDSGDSTCWFCTEIYSGKYRCNTGTNAAYDTTVSVTSTRSIYNYKANAGTMTLSVGSASYSGSYSGTVASSYPLALFTGNRSGEFTTYACKGMRVYSCKFYTGSSFTLVRDFYPCYRKSDTKPGLFDIVNNVFYTNIGTSEFTYGSKYIKKL